MALSWLQIIKSAKPVSRFPLYSLVSVVILIFSLYTGIASPVHAKQAAKQQGYASAVDSESANMGNVASKDSMATKGLPSKKQAQERAANSDKDKQIFRWLRSNWVQLIAAVGVVTTIILGVLNYRITFLKWIGRNSGLSQNNIAKRYRDRLREELIKDSIFEMPGIDSDKATVNQPDTFIPLDLSIDNPGKQLLGEGNLSYVSPEKALKDAVSSSVRMLLIKGEPGSGKTTIIKHFALSSDIKLPGFAFPLPVLYLPLSIMGSLDEKRDSLDTKLSEYFAPHLKIKSSFFYDRLKNGKTLVLLDGLDELSDREQRKKVCAWITKAAQTWSEAFFVMTTRDNGYREQEQSALRIDKQIAYVQRFNPEQQRMFLEKWFRAALLRELPKKDRSKSGLRRRLRQ